MGVADFNGIPQLFQSEWRDGEDLETDSFLLMPIDTETLALALEDWAIWRRYETALYEGKTTVDFHPALPEETARQEEIKKLLEGRLAVDPAQAIRKKAEFRVREDPSWSGYGWRPLEVRWLDIDEC